MSSFSETSVQMYYDRRLTTLRSSLRLFQSLRKIFHHNKSTFISVNSRIIVIDLRMTSNSLLKNALPGMTIFVAKDRNSIADSSSRCEIVALFRRSVIVFLARSSLFEESLVYISILSSSILRKSAMISRIFFVWLIIRLKSLHSSSNCRLYIFISAHESRIAKKSFR